MTDSPAPSSPDPASPAASPPSASRDPADPLAQAAPAGPAWDDPVEAQGAAFAREADEDLGTPRPEAPVSAGDLSPDFLAPEQPA